MVFLGQVRAVEIERPNAHQAHRTRVTVTRASFDQEMIRFVFFLPSISA